MLEGMLLMVAVKAFMVPKGLRVWRCLTGEAQLLLWAALPDAVIAC